MLGFFSRVLQAPELTIGRGSISRLKFLHMNKVVIFCGLSSLEKSGNFERLNNALKKANGVSIYKGLNSDPGIQDILDASEYLKHQQPDTLIAIGGGSVIDTAKLALSLYQNDSQNLELFHKSFSVPTFHKKLHFVAIPTTHGSGSEASNCAVYSDLERNKIPIVSDQFLPSHVILDPQFTLLAPKSLKFCSTIDALTHAVESFCSRKSSLMADSLAISAGNAIREALPKALDNEKDLAAHESLLNAAYFAGLAQSLTSVGAVHALSHAMSSDSSLSHGHGNSIFLSSVLKENAKTSPKPELFANRIGFSSLQALVDWISTHATHADVNLKWLHSVSLQGDFSIQKIANLAVKDICMKTNPKPIPIEIVERILEETSK